MRRELAIALVGLLTVACKRGEEVEPVVSAKAVKCAPVQSAAIKDAIEVRGTAAPLPDRDAQVAPQVAGRILRVEVREGDQVKRGQVVARIDDAPLIDAAHQSEAALSRARAEYENAQTTRTRIQRVFEHGIAARQEVDDAAAKEVSAKAATDEAMAAARQSRRQIERATVRSPLAGVVLKVLRKPGELVDGTPATPVVEIADVSKLELVADVPAQDLVRLARGAEGTVRFSALPGSAYRATVAQVSPSVDRTTGVGSVRMAIGKWEPSKGSQALPRRVAPSEARRLPTRPGTSVLPPVGAFGIARVEIGEARQAILVPQAAVRSVVGGEGEIVICGSDHRAHVREVTRGLAQGGAVEVRGRIAATDRVVVAPVLGISDGDRLEVTR